MVASCIDNSSINRTARRSRTLLPASGAQVQDVYGNMNEAENITFRVDSIVRDPLMDPTTTPPAAVAAVFAPDTFLAPRPVLEFKFPSAGAFRAVCIPSMGFAQILGQLTTSTYMYILH